MGTVAESGLSWGACCGRLAPAKVAALSRRGTPGSAENKAPSLCRLPRDPPNDSEDERRRGAAG